MTNPNRVERIQVGRVPIGRRNQARDPSGMSHPNRSVVVEPRAECDVRYQIEDLIELRRFPELADGFIKIAALSIRER